MIQFTGTHIGVSYWQNFVSFPIQDLHSGVESTVFTFHSVSNYMESLKVSKLSNLSKYSQQTMLQDI